MEDSGPAGTGDGRVRLAGLRGSDRRDFRIEPDAVARDRIMRELGLLGLRKLRLSARLIPEGQADWRLEGDLGATVIQPCVATLAPVTTRIDAPVLRRYLAEPPAPVEGDEVEIPEDDSIEPLPAEIDLTAILTEELALNLPLYPRAADTVTTSETFAAPGVEPMTDAEAKPFAGLAALRAKLGRTED